MSSHKEFFKQMIYEFFHDDLESCLKVSKIKQGIINNGEKFDGGLNFTAALVILCVIEMMSGFYKGKIFPNSDDVSDFLVKYFSKYEDLFSNKSFSKNFYEVFRHGLTHEWSPKASAVAMDFLSNAIVATTKPDDEEIMCINVPPLYEITLKALHDYEIDLDNGYYVDNFEKRHKETLDKDYKEMRLLREKFKSLSNKN